MEEDRREMKKNKEEEREGRGGYRKGRSDKEW